MKIKSKLSQLQVKSFVTTLEDGTENTVKGGAPTVNTLGYWSHCCGSKFCEIEIPKN